MHRKYKEVYDPHLQGTYPSWVDRSYKENTGILNSIKCQVSITVLKEGTDHRNLFPVERYSVMKWLKM